ncbi:MAG: HNH endonuclease [Magnetospirillum sp.]|nr:HNH endonuclease [Magnetospirillum sp.]
MTMVCTKGRINPSTQTKLRLFADAAGYCQRPDCTRRLFSEEGGPDYHIAEMAHIMAAADDGPRPNADLTAEDRATYDNLILLCPNCHTEIDKEPAAFPDDMLREWKQGHKDKIRAALGIINFSSRQSVRNFIEPLLRRNRAIFDAYGPDNTYRENPEAEEARVWQRMMVSQIIPNNQSILMVLDSNISLMNEGDLKTLELFRQHVDDLVERHLGEDRTVASRFPSDMATMFGDD